jgi:predicted DNA binding CopG/RHH family protein
MAGKKVNFGAKPALEEKPSLDNWVETRQVEPAPTEPEPEKMKRMTIDVPESLHRAFKTKTSADGKQMADLVRAWIEDYCKS